MTCTSYCEKIEEIFDAMIRLSDDVLPENRCVVNEYIYYAWIEVGIFTRSIQLEEGTDELRAKFKSHVDAEEERLRKNFEDIKYDVAGSESVYLVSGPRRIEAVQSFSLHDCAKLSSEQTMFPMLYLLLQRGLQKIGLAHKHVLLEYELFPALDAIQWVTVAVHFRVEELRGRKVVVLSTISAYLASVAIFKQQGLSPKEQFAVHAKGLVGVTIPGWIWVDLTATAQYNMYSDDDHSPGERLRKLLGPIPANSEITPSQDSIPSIVLNHPISDKHMVDLAAYDSPTPMVPPPGDGPDAV